MVLKSSSTSSELARFSFANRKRQQHGAVKKSISADIVEKYYELPYPPKHDTDSLTKRIKGDGIHNYSHRLFQKNISPLSKCATSSLTLAPPSTNHPGIKFEESICDIVSLHPDAISHAESLYKSDSNQSIDKYTPLPKYAWASASLILKPDSSLAEDKRKFKMLREHCTVPRYEAAMYMTRENFFNVTSSMKVSEKSKAVPPIKRKQNLMNVFSRLQTVLDKSEIANPKSNIEGEAVQKPTPTPLHLVAETPEYIDLLLKDHELEWEIEKLRQQEERKVEEGLAEEKKHPSKIVWRRSMKLENVFDLNNRVFGFHLLQMQKYASKVITMNGYQHDLPIVAHLCVEALQDKADRLFKRGPNLERVEELVHCFDSGPRYQPSLKVLMKENTSDVGEVLRQYINTLPHSLMNPAVYNAFQYWCVGSSSEMKPESSMEEVKDYNRIEIARLLFKSLPSIHFALLSYLCGFLHRISTDHRWDKLQTSRLLDMFGVPLLTLRTDFATECEAYMMMKWILDRWDKISIGIFDWEGGPASPLSIESSYLSQCGLQLSSSTSAAESGSNGSQNGAGSSPLSDCTSPAISSVTSDSKWSLQTPTDLIPVLEINKPHIKHPLPLSLDLQEDRMPALETLSIKDTVKNNVMSVQQERVCLNDRVRILRTQQF